MGSSACNPKPKKKIFPSQVEKNKPVMKTEISEKELDENYLQGLHLIWFDPNVSSEENSIYKEDLDKLFKKKNYVNSRKALEKALKAVQDIPIIVISCGDKYEIIGELVENSAQVIMIAIFCFNLELHLPKLKRHLKIAAVINTFSNLEKELREGYKNYMRYSNKFLDKAEEPTFHELKDQQEILNRQGMQGILFKEESNMTYPLYYKGFCLGQKNWQDSLTSILVASHNENLCDARDREYLGQRIVELSEDRSPKNIIRAYTRNGLYPMFNRAFQKYNKEQQNLFKLLEFALRGSMELLGDPIDPGEVFYRGLNLKPEHMKRWEDNLGEIVLLNGYTSTSLDKGLCVTGINKGNCLMEFRFTADRKIFEESLDIFNKVWSGYSGPVDIHKLSAYPREKEILFPPFYPIRIQEITHEDGIFHIVLIVPTYIIINDMGQHILRNCRQTMTSFMIDAYIERLAILMEKRMVAKVDLGFILSKCHWKEKRASILSALVENTHVDYLDLSSNGISSIELGNLFRSPQKAWKVLNLAGNQLGAVGTRIVAFQLKLLPHLEKLQLGNEEVECLAINLKFVPKLSMLNLVINNIGDEGVDILIQHLDSIPNLQSLRLRANYQISEGMEEKIMKIAKEKGIEELLIDNTLHIYFK